MSTSSFNTSALSTSPAVPPHLVLLSSLALALLTPALAGRWLICAPGNLVLLLFFSPKASKTPENLSSLFLTQKQTKTHLLQQNPTKPPPNTLSSSPAGSSHLWHARCWVLHYSLFLLVIALATWTPTGRKDGPHTSRRTVPIVNNHVLLTHCGPQAEYLSPGSCEGGRGEWPCSPQLIEGASTSEDRSGILCAINPKVYARTRNIFPAFWFNKQMALPPKIAMSPMQFERGRNFLT